MIFESQYGAFRTVARSPRAIRQRDAAISARDQVTGCVRFHVHRLNNADYAENGLCPLTRRMLTGTLAMAGGDWTNVPGRCQQRHHRYPDPAFSIKSK